jgi:hypothetical protein
MSAHDQVQGVPGVAIVKDDFVALEAPASRSRENLSLFIVVEHVKQVRRHGAEYPIS